MSVPKGGRGGWGCIRKPSLAVGRGVATRGWWRKAEQYGKEEKHPGISHIYDNGISILSLAYGINSNETLSNAYTLLTRPSPLHPHEEKRPPLFCMHMSECRNALPILGSGGAHQDSLKTKGGGGIGMGFKSLCRTHRVKRRSLHPFLSFTSHFRILPPSTFPPTFPSYPRFIHILGFFHSLHRYFQPYFYAPSPRILPPFPLSVITRRGY
ncbi:hypothetical protein CDAR_212421 [Caerostris darwini]|uniref:Uncharacterized protein n=1 Tax=Caerostris darwini TaxID=1538125 RepID=A0AAV4SEP7_9ARAC|nr:hypothetical protein CDAR_212421 [Caerostris darwini]